MKRKQIESIVLVLYAVLLMSAFSICAPHRLFTEYVDINVIFSVGKSFWRGKLVYRDLFEHKGPLMYAITAVAALFSSKSFLGVWILEVVACATFLITSLAIIRKLNPSASGIFLPVIAYLIYHSKAFIGGTAEEFCLPLLSIALLIGVRSAKDSRMPSFKESVVLGITAGIVFWIKYNMIGFFIGFLLIFIGFAWKDKAWKNLLTAVKGAVTGLLIVTVPILLFFGFNSALDDLYQVYFFDNVNNYANRLDFLYQGYYSLTGTLKTIRENAICWGVILLGVIELIIFGKNIRLVLLELFTGFFTAWFVYCGGMAFIYYGFILLLFAVFAAAFEPSLGKFKESVLPVLLCTVIFGILTSRNIRPVDPETIHSRPQFKLTELITEKDASLLTYGYFDAGFYMAGNLYPQVYHFTLTNCVIDHASEAQQKYIEEGVVDYIVATEPLYFADKYLMIASCEDWSLYKKKS